MSLDKIKSAKNVTYTDRYSKNPIINNLIKTKLETEMVSIKESFANLIKKDKQSQIRTKTNTTPLRRNKSISINPKMIKQAIQYNPIQRLNKFTQQFIAKRQIESFLIPTEQLRQINQARYQYSGLTTKLKKNDILKYETGKDFSLLAQSIKQKTIKQYSEDVWLPSKPQVTYLIEDKKNQIQEQILGKKSKNNQESELLQKFANKITGKPENLSTNLKKYTVFPLISSKVQNQSLIPTNYVPQRYHKNDYKQLDNWLTCNLQSIYKEQNKPQDKLNLVYSCYVCVWKQIIRLTYIESQQKGLIMQKMFYSMLRLFCGVISEQQSFSRNYESKLYAENNQIQNMMKQRMEQLNKRFITQTKKIDQLKYQNHQLSKIFISYEKVNHEIVQQLEKVTKQKKQFQKEFYKIGNSFLKTLQILHDKHLVQMQFTQQQDKPRKDKKNIKSTQYKSYFLFDSNSKPIVLGRFKYEDTISSAPQYVDSIDQNVNSQELRAFNERYGHNLRQIQNQLTRFWDKKQDDLQMKGIINSLIFQVRINDANVGTYSPQLKQFQCQFPENQQNYIQSLLQQLKDELNQKFNKQKNQLLTQMQQKEAIFAKWKANFQQLQQKNKNLHQNNLKLNQQIKKSKQNVNQFVKNIDQLAKSQQKNQQEIQQLKRNLQNSKSWEEQAKQSQYKAERQRDLIRLQIQRQKQNNKMLVRSNLQMKQKVEKFDIKYNNLLKSVKNVAPWLQKFMVEIDKPLQQLQINVLQTVSRKIQQHLSQFVTKDSSLFMTRLT